MRDLKVVDASVRPGLSAVVCVQRNRLVLLLLNANRDVLFHGNVAGANGVGDDIGALPGLERAHSFDLKDERTRAPLVRVLLSRDARYLAVQLPREVRIFRIDPKASGNTKEGR